MTEMTRKEQLECYIWDLYKEVHNVRPRHLNLQGMSEAELDAYAESLEREAQHEAECRREQQQKAAVAFEQRVSAIIEIGAGNRETALRWIMESDGDNYNDWEYVAYVNNLPYNYFKQAA